MRDLLVSVSAGRTSAYMALKILEAKEQRNPLLDEYGDIVLAFANTGLEHEKTYEFLAHLDKYIRAKYGQRIHMVEYGGAAYMSGGKKVRNNYVRTDVHNMDREGMPAIQAAERYGMFGPGFLHCTREMKLVPLRQVGGGGYVHAIGIRADEAERVKLVKDQIYPLVSWWPTTKKEVVEFWAGMPFDLEIDERLGNCVFCFKKSWWKLVQNAKDHPEYLDKLERVLRIAENGEKGHLNVKPFRGHKTIQDLRDEAAGKTCFVDNAPDEPCDCGDGLTNEQIKKLTP